MGLLLSQLEVACGKRNQEETCRGSSSDGRENGQRKGCLWASFGYDRRYVHLGTYLNGGAFDKINLIVNSIAE